MHSWSVLSGAFPWVSCMVSGFVGDCAGRLRVEVPSPASRAGSAHLTMVSAGQPFRLVLAVPPSRRALVVL
ncbi:hypothetical protein ACZ91_43255 [Streptomyces regensis]|nr:hypothetical protein ACZ91_43255 [Streptomyces regensis]KOG75806.1 hypothetical protein ADK77_01705 [Streptomyces antibioticus]